jgi:hypothetical protein
VSSFEIYDGLLWRPNIEAFARTVSGYVDVVKNAAEMALAKKHFPQVREFFFDDDTFTDDLPRAEEIALVEAGEAISRRLGWSPESKARSG